VKALAKEIADVGTSLAKMTLSDNDFQQKTQIAILEHLGKAQAQIAKDVAEAVKVS
jgi:precorrin-6B methylase 1